MIQFLGLLCSIAATTVTFKLGSHERVCFYSETKAANEKIAFYFSVQSGGNFDVDYDVLDPNSVPMLTGNHETGGDYAFTAMKIGEYSFCFSNAMSTFVDKVIDVDISVEHETADSKLHVKGELEQSAGSITPPTAPKKESAAIYTKLLDVSAEIEIVEGLQRDFRTRENRSISTVKDLESRLFWVALMSSIVIIGMAIGQVYVIQTFFTKGSIM